MAFVPEDVDRMARAAAGAGVVAQAAYMKLYDPAFRLLEREVEAMEEPRFAQVNHLHTDNRHHLAHFRLRRADDLPDSALREGAALRDADAARALGDAPGPARSAFFHLAGSMIHDLYGLRHLFGPPGARGGHRDLERRTGDQHDSGVGRRPALCRNLGGGWSASATSARPWRSTGRTAA